MKKIACILLATFLTSIIMTACKKKKEAEPAPVPAVPATTNISLSIALADYNNSTYAPYTFSSSVVAKIKAFSGSNTGAILGTYNLTVTNPSISSTSITTSPCYYGFSVNSISTTIEQGSTFLIEIYDNSVLIATFKGDETSVNTATYPISYTDTYTVAYICSFCCSQPFLVVVAR
jgi:hypothetical protein